MVRPALKVLGWLLLAVVVYLAVTYVLSALGVIDLPPWDMLDMDMDMEPEETKEGYVTRGGRGRGRYGRRRGGRSWYGGGYGGYWGGFYRRPWMPWYWRTYYYPNAWRYIAYPSTSAYNKYGTPGLQTYYL